MNYHRFGYSTGVFTIDKLSLEDRVRLLFEFQRDVIEVGLGRVERLQQTITDQTFQMVRQFAYRSLHAPSDIRYPSKESVAWMPTLLAITDRAEIHTVVVHPDIVDDVTYLSKCFGSRLALENSDVNKSFGQTVEDMEGVLEQAPDAGWICDTNHFYTIDRSMKIADAFHARLGNRLRHYHVSAYQGFHHPFVAFDTRAEDVILSGIRNLRVPIIHEGGTKGMKNLLAKERDYVLERLKPFYVPKASN